MKAVLLIAIIILSFVLGFKAGMYVMKLTILYSLEKMKEGLQEYERRKRID